MNSQNHNCEQFEPLISAMLDGELDSTELESLRQHTDGCAACRSVIQEFENVNAAVLSLSAAPRIDNLNSSKLNGSAALVLPKPPQKKSPSKSPRKLWRLIPIAVAATLLVCLAITALPGPGSAAAQMQPDQIVEPMKDFLISNYRQQQDQELMLRTLDWDLRTLKLELNQLADGSEERVNLESQIDVMIAKIKLFELANSPDLPVDR